MFYSANDFIIYTFRESVIIIERIKCLRLEAFAAVPVSVYNKKISR